MRKQLKLARDSKGLTQAQAAEYLEVGVRTYQRIESGETLGSIKHWDKLEDLFGIPQRELREITTDKVIERDFEDVSYSD